MTGILLKHPYYWYAVYTKSRAEKKVYSELKRKRIEAYLPLKKERRQWSDRVKIVEEPLLRGYLFVKVSNKEYYDVLITSGVLRYVCFGGKATAIPEYQILDLIRFLEVTNNYVEVTSEHIAKGDQARVSCGPMKDICGEVVEIRGKARLLLRFDSLGYNIYVELGMNKVDIINKKRLVPASL